jgi:hypothetical protein
MTDHLYADAVIVHLEGQDAPVEADANIELGTDYDVPWLLIDVLDTASLTLYMLPVQARALAAHLERIADEAERARRVR